MVPDDHRPEIPPNILPLATTMIDMPPLEDRVLSALERNPYLPPRTLRFETSQGRVTLRGTVGTYYQKQMAQESLRHVAGIHEIANELEVCWS
jgi:osmotically-inducible protein OsmY